MINETTSATARVVQSSAPPSASGKATISSDFETFLKMLTAQARYQDPLEPIDSTEYAAQLAQFSMVEQQVKTNDTLAGFVSQLGSQNAASLSAWVGKEVRAEAPARFDGSPITVSPQTAPGADKAYLVVSNDAGTIVDRKVLPMTGGNVIWSGLDGDGMPFASGIYRFAVESHSGEENLGTAPAEVYSTVHEAQIEAGEVVLVLDGGQTVSALTVSALRNPA
jgi:flagellar basal-body rod modification protein FlgD